MSLATKWEMKSEMDLNLSANLGSGTRILSPAYIDMDASNLGHARKT